MAQKQFSSTLFWAKHIGLAAVLIVVASVLIFMQGEQESEPVPEGETKEKSVSQGLTDFYREFRQSSTEIIKEELGDFVMDVGKSEEPVDTQLKNMSSRTRPVSDRWRGEEKFRTFKAGSTLREMITMYAEQEGMQLIWDLDQDFVVKHQFQMERTIAGTVAAIASAVNSNFSGDVAAYLCPRQRTIVVTAEPTEYLLENCEVVTGN